MVPRPSSLLKGQQAGASKRSDKKRASMEWEDEDLLTGHGLAVGKDLKGGSMFTGLSSGLQEDLQGR